MTSVVDPDSVAEARAQLGLSANRFSSNVAAEDVVLRHYVAAIDVYGGAVGGPAPDVDYQQHIQRQEERERQQEYRAIRASCIAAASSSMPNVSADKIIEAAKAMADFIIGGE